MTRANRFALNHRLARLHRLQQPRSVVCLGMSLTSSAWVRTMRIKPAAGICCCTMNYAQSVWPVYKNFNCQEMKGLVNIVWIVYQ